MKVLVACEFSGIVRDAFKNKGHNAWSCDFLDSEKPGQHIKGNVKNIINENWDLMIAHPPCTYLAVSGARWFKYRIQEQEKALEFVKELMNANIPKIVIENPISIISTKIRKPDQIIQPWQFGHLEMKRTCLWLKNLPLLEPTADIKNINWNEVKERIYYEKPGPERWKNRSRFFPLIAKAMAEQWS